MEPRDLRVSDAERQHVAELLQRAVGAGYITLTEFEERTTKVFESTTRGELDEVVADIPSAEHEKSVAVQPTSDEVMEIRGKGTTITRKGDWRVPAKLQVENKYGTTTLDFTQAVFTNSVVDMEITDKAGSITVIVPDAATVDCNGLEMRWGDVSSRVPSGPPRGNPHFIVHGTMRYGSLVIRRSRKGSWWVKLGLS